MNCRLEAALIAPGLQRPRRDPQELDSSRAFHPNLLALLLVALELFLALLADVGVFRQVLESRFKAKGQAVGLVF